MTDLDRELQLTRVEREPSDLEKALSSYTDAQVALDAAYKQRRHASGAVKEFLGKLPDREILLSGLVIARQVRTARGMTNVSIGSRGYLQAPPDFYEVIDPEADLHSGCVVAAPASERFHDEEGTKLYKVHFVMPYETLQIYPDEATLYEARAQYNLHAQ